MPRTSRLDIPGALHHIICRGVNRQTIFLDKEDYNHFLARTGRIFSETKTPCYAWALIPNHFHLLLRTGETPISKIMQKLLTGYAVSHNHRHKRSGHLFQNRYKSILCQEDPYLLELIRYIHLNPLRTGLVSDYKTLGRYLYCGHGVILGYARNDWQDIDFVLRLFGERETQARRKYEDFVQRGLDQGKRPDLTGGGLLRSYGGWTAVKAMRSTGNYQKGDERILGDGDFVEEVLSQAEERLDKRYRLRREGYDLDRLCARVGELLGMKPEEILEKGREKKRVKARSILCYLATERLGISQMALSERLGLTQPAVSQAVRRGEKLMEKMPRFSL